MSVLALLGKLLELAGSIGRGAPGAQGALRPAPVPVRTRARRKK